jgi:hypothetical protein
MLQEYGNSDMLGPVVDAVITTVEYAGAEEGSNESPFEGPLDLNFIAKAARKDGTFSVFMGNMDGLHEFRFPNAEEAAKAFTDPASIKVEESGGGCFWHD